MIPAGHLSHVCWLVSGISLEQHGHRMVLDDRSRQGNGDVEKKIHRRTTKQKQNTNKKKGAKEGGYNNRCLPLRQTDTATHTEATTAQAERDCRRDGVGSSEWEEGVSDRTHPTTVVPIS